MITSILKLIAKPFIGTGITRFFPFLSPLFDSVYARFSSGDVVSYTLKSGMTLKTWDNDTCVGIFLATKGEFEPLETELMVSTAKKVNTYVDIGANVGYYVLECSTLVDKTIAFEPDSEIREMLRTNLSENKIDNVKIESYALGNTASMVGFNPNKIHRGKSAVVENEDGEYQVEMITFDSYVQKYDVNPEMVKVDIEGAEIAFLQGAKESLTNKTKHLFIEYNPESLKDFNKSGDEMLSLIFEYGFSIKIVDEVRGKVLEYSKNELTASLRRQTYTNLYCYKV